MQFLLLALILSRTISLRSDSWISLLSPQTVVAPRNPMMSLPEGCSSGLIIPWKLENGVDPVVFDDEHKTLTMNIFQCDDPDVQVVSEVLTANCQDKPGKTGGVLVNVTSGACYDAGGDEQPCTGVASDGLHRNIQTTITIDEASVIQDPTLYSDEVIEGDMKGVVSFCRLAARSHQQPTKHTKSGRDASTLHPSGKVRNKRLQLGGLI